jgi:hypothetical protein
VDDLAIGARGAGNSGRAYVVFGATSGFDGVDLATLDGDDGLRIDGGHAVAGAGDVNGDGLGDLLVGGGEDTTYVIFGSAEGFDPTLSLADLDGYNGFRIDGSDGPLSAVGDLNADGIGDFMIGDTVLFGDPGGFGSRIDLGALDGSRGFRVAGGWSASADAGDFNDDGIDDLVIGVPGASPNDGTIVGSIYAGSTYVVFGSTALGGVNEVPSAADDDLAVGSGLLVDLTDDHGAGFDMDPDFDDLTITAIDGVPLDARDSVPLASGLRVTLGSGAEVRFDSLELPFGATLSDDFLYEISDGRGGSDVASVSVAFTQNEVRTVDGTGGFRADWRKAGDGSGYAVASAGDVNGDGVDDLIIGAPHGGKRDAGRAWIVFGSPQGFDPRLDLADLDGETGFVIRGADHYDHFGHSVAGAGDVNGDGIDDIIVGAPGGGAVDAGRAYVIFGSTDGFDARLYLDDLDGETGFSVWGENRNDHAGVSVAGAGDLNGDGFDDIAIGVLGTGRAHVIHGTASGLAPQLGLADAASVPAFYDQYEARTIDVADAGDINGDGFDDLLIGAVGVEETADSGYATVVLGAADGFGSRFYDFPVYPFTGLASSVAGAGAGDVNGDGFDDMIVAWDSRDLSYVVFGSEDFAGFPQFVEESGNSDFDVENGFAVIGGAASVDGAGDFDGDGFDDLIVSSTGGDAYLVLGRASGFAPTVDLASLADEFRFTGAAGQVAGAGDVNNDGYDDLILGSPGADPGGRQNAGSSFIIFGHAMDGAGPAMELAHRDRFHLDDTAPPPAVDALPTTPDPLFL